MGHLYHGYVSHNQRVTISVSFDPSGTTEVAALAQTYFEHGFQTLSDGRRRDVGTGTKGSQKDAEEVPCRMVEWYHVSFL
jgi:hypothetical protein